MVADGKGKFVSMLPDLGIYEPFYTGSWAALSQHLASKAQPCHSTDLRLTIDSNTGIVGG